MLPARGMGQLAPQRQPFGLSGPYMRPPGNIPPPIGMEPGF